MSASPGFDVGLVVPLQEEFRYVRKVLEPEDPIEWDGSYYFPLSTPSDAPRMVAVVLEGMGLPSAAVATDRLLNRFAVRTVAMVGIAGALDDELRLGDVVIASKVDYYQRAAKVVAGAAGGLDLELSGDVFQGPYHLLQLARNLENMPEGAQKLKEWRDKAVRRRTELKLPPSPVGGAVKYVVAPIASGDFVGAASAFGPGLKARRDRKLVAIEMEAAGAAYATYSRAEGVPLLVVRGISDFADERKAELDRTAGAEGGQAWRQYATMNAFEVLVCLLTCAASRATSPTSPRRVALQDEAFNVEQSEDLERLIARIYTGNSAIERLLYNAQIDPLMIDVSGSVIEVAHRGVQAALQQGKLRSLIAAMKRDFPEHPKLRGL